MSARWTAERDARLTALWTQVDPVLSTAAIGREMEISKGAVVGRALRLALPRREPGRRPAGAWPPLRVLAPVAPPVPVALVDVGEDGVPRLPAASNGRHYCSFREIKAWAAHFGIAYNGANIEAVNRRRKLMRLLPVVQDEDRTAADARAA